MYNIYIMPWMDSVQLADTLSTSQASTTPPQSHCLSRPVLEKRSTTSEPSETDTYTSGEIWSRSHLIRDRMSSFHSGISHVSGGSKWGKNNGSCMILVKTREPISETSGISDVDWKLFKKLVIDVLRVLASKSETSLDDAAVDFIEEKLIG